MLGVKACNWHIRAESAALCGSMRTRCHETHVPVQNSLRCTFPRRPGARRQVWGHAVVVQSCCAVRPARTELGEWGWGRGVVRTCTGIEFMDWLEFMHFTGSALLHMQKCQGMSPFHPQTCATAHSLRVTCRWGSTGIPWCLFPANSPQSSTVSWHAVAAAAFQRKWRRTSSAKHGPNYWTATILRSRALPLLTHMLVYDEHGWSDFGFVLRWT